MDKKQGRGKKTCCACQKIVGVRTKICECGYDFTSAKADKEIRSKAPERIEAEELMAAMNYTGLKILYIPAGNCGIDLSDYIINETDVDIENYCEDVVSHYYPEYFASPFMLRHFIRKFFADNPNHKGEKLALQLCRDWQNKYVRAHL